MGKSGNVAFDGQTVGLKRCDRCKKEKQRYEFFSGPSFPDGLFPVCKVCCKRMSRGLKR
jgi:hypothetical protein